MKSLRILNNQKGYVMVTVGVSLLAFVSLFALVADLGNIFVTKSQLQNTADAAVLAAVVDIPKGTTTARTKAMSFATSHFAAGTPVTINSSDVVFGNYNFSTKNYRANVTPYNAVVVNARKSADSPAGALPLFFAPIFGQDFTDVRATARAVLDPHVVGVTGKNRLIPYSVIDFVVDQNRDGKFDVGSKINIHPRSDAPGNFGFLDLDGGSNDIVELRQYIEEGYDSDFIIPPGGIKPVLGSTGIDGNSLITSFNKILNEVVFLPVHTRVDYEGSNAVYSVIAILAVEIQRVKLTGSHDTRVIEVKIINYASSVLVTHPDAPVNTSVVKPRLVA
jgi:hypothetical protein